MGMFDTIHLEKPIACKTCGAGILDFQTKQFESLMLDYHIGSVLQGGRILSGILKEEAYCDACSSAGKPSWTDVYMVVWHSILAGVETDEKQAQARLDAVDRLDLVQWLVEAQRKTREWKQRFYSLHNELRKWQNHLEEQKKPAENDVENPERKRRIGFFFGPPEEILQATDPIAKILEIHSPNKEKSASGFF
jgi:hypothetical protein